MEKPLWQGPLSHPAFVAPSFDVSAMVVMVNPRRKKEWGGAYLGYHIPGNALQALQTAKSLMELTSRLAAESAWLEAA